MTNLENYIRKHQSLFDEEPDSGHYQRMQQKIENLESEKKQVAKKATKTTKSVDFMFVLKVAAAAVLLLFVSYWFHLQTNSQIQPQNEQYLVSLSDLSTEYKEVEEFYRVNVDKKIRELKQLDCNNSGEQHDSIFDDLDELDRIYRALQKELQLNTHDDRIISAMIGNYQTRVELLNQVIMRLKMNC